MTRVIYEPENFRLCIYGHAGAAERGKDIVCAGASALGFTLLAAALEREDYHAAYHMDEAEGLLDTRCEPEEAARGDCRYLFEIIAGGFEMMATSYADNLTFERSEF